MDIRLRLRKSDIVGAGLALSAFFVIAVMVGVFRDGGLAPGSVATSDKPVVRVSQRDRHFRPDVLTVAPGTIVHIVNDDTVTHHVYVKSPVMNFESGEQPVGSAVDLEFDHPGIFNVLCAIHPTMHLQVTVK